MTIQLAHTIVHAVGYLFEKKLLVVSAPWGRVCTTTLAAIEHGLIGRPIFT